MKIAILFLAIAAQFFSLCNTKKKDSNNNPLVYIDTTHYNIGDTLMPFVSYDFKQGSWEAVIKISSDDNMDLSDKISQKSKLSTEDQEVLQRVNNWKFIYGASDMATVLNSFELFHNSLLVDSYEIIIDKQIVGLQSRKYGWLLAVDSSYIYETIRLFK